MKQQKPQSIRCDMKEGAKLYRVNFESTDLVETRLQGADMRNANMKHANLWNAILPDSTRWTAETDMTRYTDPNHPNFWQPDWVTKAGE